MPGEEGRWEAPVLKEKAALGGVQHPSVAINALAAAFLASPFDRQELWRFQKAPCFIVYHKCPSKTNIILLSMTRAREIFTNCSCCRRCTHKRQREKQDSLDLTNPCRTLTNTQPNYHHCYHHWSVRWQHLHWFGLESKRNSALPRSPPSALSQVYIIRVDTPVPMLQPSWSGMNAFQGVAGNRDKYHLLESFLRLLSGANPPQTAGEKQPHAMMSIQMIKPQMQSAHPNQTKAFSKSYTSPKQEHIALSRM